MVLLMSRMLLVVAYALVLVCALAFVTNLLRCLKFLVSSSNIELTVEQQRLFGVTDFGWCCINCLCQFLTESGFLRVLKHLQFVSFSLFCDFLVHCFGFNIDFLAVELMLRLICIKCLFPLWSDNKNTAS